MDLVYEAREQGGGSWEAGMLDCGSAVVVGVDFSPESEQALAIALGISRVRVHAAHVLSLRELSRETDTPSQIDCGAARSRLEALCVRYQVGLSEAILLHVMVGDEVDALLRLAHEQGATLIALGTRGHGLSRLLHRSVADRIAREGSCSVVVAKERATEPPPPVTLLPRLVLQ